MTDMRATPTNSPPLPGLHGALDRYKGLSVGVQSRLASDVNKTTNIKTKTKTKCHKTKTKTKTKQGKTKTKTKAFSQQYAYNTEKKHFQQ